jgi:hypothetical protein
MFKSDNGADAFCQLLSIVDTARKNNQEPVLALIAVAHNVKQPDGWVGSGKYTLLWINLRDKKQKAKRK